MDRQKRCVRELALAAMPVFFAAALCAGTVPAAEREVARTSGKAAASTTPDWQQAPAKTVSRASHKMTHAEVFADETPTPAEEIVPVPDGEFESSGVHLEEGEYLVDGPGGTPYSDQMDGDQCQPACGPDCPGCEECDRICIPRLWLNESSVFAGSHGFKNPVDQGQNGNFGFNEGFNLAGPLFRWHGIGYQVGARFAQSNFFGDPLSGTDNGVRHQSFLTAGLYRRADGDWGWQGGVVFDLLEDRYYLRGRAHQVRGEISFLGFNQHELGIWAAVNTNEDNVTLDGTNTILTTTDLYAVFYRRSFDNFAQGRAWVGGSGVGDGLVGAEFRVPMSNRWDLTGGFNYLIPEQSKSEGAASEESWGLSLNLIWYPFRRARGHQSGQFRSLFGVADNGVMMLDREQP